MDANSHVLWLFAYTIINELGVLSWERIEVFATAGSCLSHLEIAQISEVRIVELHKLAARRAECCNFLAVAEREVIKEVVQVGVGLNVDG